MAASSRTYSGWQLEKVSFLFGLSGIRVATVGSAVALAVIPVAEARVRTGVVAWPVSVFLLLLAFVRVGGRTADEWAVVAMSFGLNKARNRTQFASGAFAPRGRSGGADLPPMDLPGILAPLRFLTAPNGIGGEMAVIHHPHDRTYSAAARVTFPGIGLVDSNRRDRRVAGWGGLLDALCTEGQPIIRVQALQRIVPETGQALHKWHTDHRAPTAPALALGVADALVSSAAPTTARRESYLVFTLDAVRAASQIRAAGGGDTGACAILVQHVRALTSAITAAALEVGAWLGPRELAAVVRAAFDPAEQTVIDARSAREQRSDGAGLAAGTDPRVAGPAAAENGWGVYRHDGAWSVAFVISSWPDTPVYANFLEPLLAEAKGNRRCFSLHYEPLGPRSAQRAVAIERTKRETARRLRQRTGQIVPEHERLAEERAHRQDVERAHGHGLVRWSGYVSVTVTDLEELDGAISSLRADADRLRIELRRMYGAQDQGFALASLPLGLGLPKRRM